MGVLRVACRGVVCGNRRLYGGMNGLKCLGGGRGLEDGDLATNCILGYGFGLAAAM
jgi:hypothetical protein